MIYLVLDTSSTNLTVSLVKDKELLSFQKLENIIGHSTILLKEIDNVLAKNHISISSIDTILVVNGPGSFTGLRVGVTVAKILAYTLNIKIIPISSLEFMASTNCDGDYIIPYIDARRGYVYAGIYDSNLQVIMKDSYISVDELLVKIPVDKKIVFVGNVNVKGIENPIRSKENIISIIEKHKNDEGVNPHLVNPNYLKRVEAEEKLHDSKSN